MPYNKNRSTLFLVAFSVRTSTLTSIRYCSLSSDQYNTISLLIPGFQYASEKSKTILIIMFKGRLKCSREGCRGWEVIQVTITTDIYHLLS